MRGRGVSETDLPEQLVPEGWSAVRWRERLLYLAELCEQLNPQRAEFLRRWARAVAVQCLGGSGGQSHGDLVAG